MKMKVKLYQLYQTIGEKNIIYFYWKSVISMFSFNGNIILNSKSSIMFQFQVNEDHKIELTPTQQRIQHLLSNIKSPETGLVQSLYQPLPQSLHFKQLKEYKQGLKTKLYSMNENLNSQLSELAELEHQIENIKNKKKLNIQNIQFEDSIQMELREGAYLLEKCNREREQLQKHYQNKLLDAKILLTEKQEKFKNDLPFLKKQIFQVRLQKLKRDQITKRVSLSESLTLEDKLNNLKKWIDQQKVEYKKQKAKAKNQIADVFQSISKSIGKQEKILQQSFQLHLQTLEKLLVSVSEKIV